MCKRTCSLSHDHILPTTLLDRVYVISFLASDIIKGYVYSCLTTTIKLLFIKSVVVITKATQLQLDRYYHVLIT